MNKSEEETIAALTLLFAKVAALEQMSVREMLTPGRYDQYKATLDEAYDALVTVEDALDSLGMKLEYQHWRISSAFEELTSFLYNLVLVSTSFMTPLSKRCSAKKENFHSPSFPRVRN